MKGIFRKTEFIHRAAIMLLLLATSTTSWAQHSPTLSVEACEGKRGSLYVKGWCEDPDDISIPLTVEVHILDADHNHVQGSPIYLTANKERFGEDNQWHNNGFESYIPITTAATYRVSVYANDATGDANTTWNDYLVQVAVSAPYTVTYNANGGSGAPAAQKKHHGIDLTLSSNVPVNGDYGLVRWNTASNGGGISYQPGDTYTTDADVTLYAIWTATGFPGSGSEAAPYIISSTEQWNLFASNVNNGNTYNGKWFKLGADITVSTMAGTYDTPFQGTFDGDGHTMNLAINATGIVGTGHPYLAVAPFRYVNGATFKNLHTTGTVTRTDYSGESNMAFGGLIGAVWQYRSATIIGCRSSVNVNYSFDWEDNTWVTGHLGGFIGWNDGNVTFTDCLFDGTLAGRPYHAGGFVGWHRWGSMTLNNCLMNGTGSGLYGNGGFKYTFCGLENSVSPTFNNCYYKTSIGGGQGASTNNSGETLRAQLGHGWIVSGSAVVPCRALVLFSTANNTTAVASANNHTYDKVVLDGRTFYRDGSWNTICLPFNLNSFSGTPLEGATVKTLASSAYSNGTMTLTFTQVNSIQAGNPYIVKWSSGSNLVTPVFNNVTVSNTTSNINTTYANFIGGYAPFQNLTYLYDAHNTGGNAMHGALNICDPAPVTGQSVYWYTNSGHTQLATTIPFATDGNVTLYGVWSGDFNITYDLAGGSVATPNPTTYTAQTNTFTLVNPTRDGYVFTGWTGSNGNTPQTNVTITKGSTGDRHYTANWRVRVDYQSYNTSTYKFETLAVPEGFQYLEGSTSTTDVNLSGGWYVVKDSKVTVKGRIQIGVNTTVRIVLCDGVKLTLTRGITLQPSSTLIIYGQSAGTGELSCNLNGQSNVIGTPQDQSGGTITIHGGKVTATTNNGSSAAIGGFGNYGGGANVTIYGGNVTAKGTGGSGSGIGGSGWYGKGGTVNIQGGTVEVQAGTDGMSYAIGGYTDHGSLTLGNVRVYASSNASTPVGQGSRVSTCRSTYAKIVKCTQHVASGSKCQYCNATIRQVTYNSNGATGGTVPASTTHANNDYVTVQGNTGNLVRTGYTFSGWNTKADGTGTNYAGGASFKIAGNVTLYAKWTPITYTVHFNKNHSDATGTMSNQTLTYDAAQALTPNSFSRSGYDFMGWSTTANGSVVYTNGQSVSNLASEKDAVVNLYAIWQLNTYSITYNLNEGSVATPNPASYTVLSDAITLVNPTREGYTFTGWTGTGLNGPTLTVTIPHGSVGDRSYKATWTLTYTISYDLADGSLATPNPTTYTEVGSNITLVNPTRDGYTFAGWTGTELNEPTTTVTISHGSTGNRSYTATWVPNYALTYDLAGGTASNPTYYCVLSDAITLNNPIRTGYTFAGWIGTDLDGPTMIVTIPHGSEGDRSYTATWTLDVYTIGYDLAGGSVETNNPTSYTYIDEDITLVNPTREGYYFVGWTGTGLTEPTQNVMITAGSTGNRSYTAVWTELYTISYDGLVEGIFPSEPPTTYTVLSETVTLVNPVRELYDFAGWTGTGLSAPTMTVTIAKGSTGNRSYHATWSLKEGQYVSYNPETGEYEAHAVSSPPHFTTTDATTIGTAGKVTWYLVKDAGVTASERLTVRGTVNLILADGASLRASKGITVHSGNTLNIYGQAGGTGSLNATVYSDNNAAIGTENNYNTGNKTLGTITIHGGNITATNSTDWSAGIGGGVGGGGGSIAIYGGTVRASASSNPDYGEQQAIGKGSSGYDVARTIADGLCVYVGNNTTPVNYGNRIGSLNNKVVKVKPCTEHNWDGSQCTYCHAYQHHQIFYDGNGYTDGDVPEDATFDVDGIIVATGTVAEAGTMERTGYTFTGWNTEADGSGTAYEPGATVTLRSNLTLYAQWTLEEYSITYDLAGGTLPNGKSNPTTYTSESDDITLVNPIREGYAFAGWTGTDLDDVTEEVTIYSGWTGNRTYTATWLGLPPDVSLVKNSLTPNGATVKWTGSSDSYTLQYAEGDPFIVLFSEGFEGGYLPEGWTTIGSYWDFGSGTGHEDYKGAATGNYNATCFYEGVSDEDNYLITPTMVLSSVASATLAFNFRNVSWGGDLNKLHVYYRVGDGEWNELYSNTDEVSDWTLVTIPLENLAANYQIGFKCNMNYGYGMGIDDVKVLTDNPDAWTTVDNAHSPYTFDDLELETTYSVRVIGVTEGQDNKMSNIFSFTTLESNPKPFGFDIVENTLTAHSATVSWKGFSDSYNIRLNEDNSIVRADFETGDLSQASFTTTDDYPWTVVKNDDSGSWCAKSATGNHGETSALEIQVTLEDDRVLTFSAKVSSEEGYDKAYFSIDETEEDETKEIDGISGDGEWIDYPPYLLTAGTHTLRWYYVKDGGDSANDDCFYVDNIRIANENDMTSLGTYTSSTTNYNFTDLDAEKTYLVQVQGVKENVTTDWSEPYAFTTATSCPKPTDLIAGTPDAHSVELSWTENGTATQWQICVNGDMSNLMTVSTNPYTLSGLSGDTDYAVKVRAYNNANEQSRWSNVVTFTTDIACFAPSDLTIGAISSRSVELSWTENDSSNKWVIEYSTDDEFTDAKSVEVTGTPSHTLTALTSGYTYYVHVRAINSDYELSRWSEYECFDAKQVIGDGGSDTNDNLPLNTDRKYSLSQQIYTASELGEAGFIESIDFYADCYATRNIDIYMVSTSKSSFESGTDWVAVTASDLVFSGEVQFNNDGWKTITLDRYFEYDGTNNIVLVVDDNTGSNTYNYYHAFHVFDATNQAIYVNGSSDYDPFNPSSGTVLDVKNQIRLAISVSPKPTDVTATDIAATSATISWNGEGENYDVKYREATVSSTWLSEALFFENFEDGLGNWTRYAAGYSGSSTNWQPINPLNDKQTFQYISAYSRNYVAMSRSNVGTAVDNWLVTPPMTLGDVLKFHAHDDGTHHEHFEVYVSTKTKAISDFEKVADPSISNGSWNEIIVDLSAYAGQEGYIAIRHNDTGKNFLFIDDFGVYKTIYEYTYGTETTLTCTTNSCELTGLSAGKKYEVQVQAVGGAEGTSQWSDPIIFDTPFFDLILANAADNSDAISMAATNGGEFNVTLAGRTLWKDGDWNTICLPFNLGDPQAEEGHYFDGTLLEGATVKTLESTEFEDGVLTMNFVDVHEIAAGAPYIVKWEGDGNNNLVNPVFTNVTISDATANISTNHVDFIGTYAPVTYTNENRSVLFLGGGSNLYYPDGASPVTINACRAYFTLNGITAGDPESGVKGFVLNFGEDDADGISSLTPDPSPRRGEEWYDLSGRVISNGEKPTGKGMYIHNGRKIIIK